MDPIQYIEEQREVLLQTYQDLHALAEPSWEEKETSRYIADRLRQAGFAVQTFPDHYGMIAEIPGRTDTVIALRADMDALVQEVDGVIKPNHSCGHDAHSTMVLYAALAIAASGIQPAHTLRFIFQPAEEKGEGALRMVQEGALENVSYLFGVHVRPHMEVSDGQAAPVIIHGAAGTIRGMVKGLQAHAARPQDGINAIEAAALLVQKLKHIQLETDVPYSIKMTQLRTENESSNIIPETAAFTIDVRAQTNEVMSELQQLAAEAMEETMRETGAAISWSMNEYVPAATINEKAMAFAAAAIADILGNGQAAPPCVSQGAEDFHYYTSTTPSIAATMVGLGCGLAPGLHHPHMSFNREALVDGAKILAQTMLLAAQE
ncbi:amidohydrolase [Ectobacillus ponti]|uniref:Amidohydrolase n=1 Tax=Ectobacillus ponti TaxID=2961894 RepID=A0AA41XBH6_9BACI|nr:amidohydrolase [Ectobacillus ponti]MCP8968986.1 amidohydrolase [Ectobacillus ponti]